MSSITGILAQVFVPSFFARRGIDQTEGSVSGKDTHLIIVGTIANYTDVVEPFPEWTVGQIDEHMGATAAIKILHDHERNDDVGEVTAHVVPVEWSDQHRAYIVNRTDGPHYRNGGNIALIDFPHAQELGLGAPIDIPAALPIHDCTK